MLLTSIVFCLRLFSVFMYDSFPTMSSITYIFLRLCLLPIAHPPKLLAACHRDVICAPANYVSSAILFLKWIFFTNSFPNIFNWNFFSPANCQHSYHTQLSKASSFFLKVSVSVHDSAAFSATLHMVFFMILFIYILL